MRSRTQKQPQVKKELCRVLDYVNVDYVKNKLVAFQNFLHQLHGQMNNINQLFPETMKLIIYLSLSVFNEISKQGMVS